MSTIPLHVYRRVLKMYQAYEALGMRVKIQYIDGTLIVDILE